MKLLLSILLCAQAMGASVHLELGTGFLGGFDGFKVYWWTSKVTNCVDVGKGSLATLEVAPGVPYTFAATAYDAFSESEFSNFVSYTYPVAPSIILPNLTLTGGDSILEESSNLVNWATAVALPTVATVPKGNGHMFYRWKQTRSRIEITPSL